MDILAKLSTADLENLVGLLRKQVAIKQVIVQGLFENSLFENDFIELWQQTAEKYDDIMTSVRTVDTHTHEENYLHKAACDPATHGAHPAHQGG